MGTACKIYSQDVFLNAGISALLNSLSAAGHDITSFRVLLISDAPLLSIPGFCQQIDSSKICIVIGSRGTWNMLSGLTPFRGSHFIDMAGSVSGIKHQLELILSNAQCSIRSGDTRFSTCEKIVLKYLIMGMSVSAISRVLGMSLKKISYHKRNVMRKMKVSSFQKLFIKSRIADSLY